MRKIAFLTGSRGEWGYIRPIIQLIDQDPELDYSIIATNMHLLSEFGISVNEIEKEGFRVDEKVYMTYDGYNAETMAKSLGSLMMELPSVLRRVKPDVLVLAGDRGEQLVGAIAGLHLGIAVAHIQAGELTGNVDGIVRHAITKLAHVHFTANEEFAQRVERMGEHKFRIYTTGAPLTDELIRRRVTNEEELRKRYNLKSNEKIILAVQHPVTEEESVAGEHIEETISALLETDMTVIFIYPNADAGSEKIRSKLNQTKNKKFKFFRNMPRDDYLGMMKIASVIVGNSSSGIMEAPTFGTPCVNIGRRQNMRLQAANVINVSYNKDEILAAIKKATDPEFVKIAKNCKNPYGDGKASEKIVKILKGLIIDEKLLNKEMAY